jgi:hypothetical protein
LGTKKRVQKSDLACNRDCGVSKIASLSTY